MGNVRMRADQINYGATSVKVALDDLDPKDLIALSKRMDKIEAWKDTVEETTVSGAEAVFTNALALPAVSLITSIEPIQDLHGYDKPWVGGAGKNKLPMTIDGIKAANTSGGTWSGNIFTSSNGGTIEILTDNDGNVNGLKVNGTFTAQTDFKLFGAYGSTTAVIGTGNYTTSMGGTLTLLVGYGSNVLMNNTSQTSATCSDGISWCFLRIAANTTVSNETIQPMIRLSTESDASFAPYSNICPISGRTEVTITDYDSESNTASVTIQFGQTVYGGSLNLTTGVLTIAKKYVDFSSLSGWTYDTANKRWSKYVDDIYDYSSRSDNIICEKYTPDTTATAGDEGKVFTVNKYILVVTTDSTNTPTGDCVYPLATHTTIQLTPTQLEMLKGYNLLSSDGGGDIEVTAYTGAAWGGDEA